MAELLYQVSQLAENAPQWLKPYLAAALRSGLVSDTEMDYNQPITAEAAAVILQNSLDLRCDEPKETYQETALAVMNENGLVLTEGEILTRADVAVILYEAYHLAQTAPGISVFNAQQ